MSAVVDLCNSDDDEDVPKQLPSHRRPPGSLPMPAAPTKQRLNKKTASNSSGDPTRTSSRDESSAERLAATASKASPPSKFAVGRKSAPGFTIAGLLDSTKSTQLPEPKGLGGSQVGVQKRSSDDTGTSSRGRSRPKKQKTEHSSQLSVGTSKSSFGSATGRNVSSTGMALANPIDLTSDDETDKRSNVLNRDVHTPNTTSGHESSSPPRPEKPTTLRGQPFTSRGASASNGPTGRLTIIPESPPLSPEAEPEKRTSPPGKNPKSRVKSPNSHATSKSGTKNSEEQDVAHRHDRTPRPIKSSEKGVDDRRPTESKSPRRTDTSPSRKSRKPSQSRNEIGGRSSRQQLNEPLAPDDHRLSRDHGALEHRNANSQPKQTPNPDPPRQNPKASTATEHRAPCAPDALPAQVNSIEKLVGQYIEEMRDDNEYWTRIALQRARAKPPRPPQQNAEGASVFSKATPIPLRPLAKKGVPSGCTKFTVELHTGTSRPPKTSYVAEYTTYSTSDTVDVPKYAHYVSIRQNMLAPNVTTLQHLPYFGDEFDMNEAHGLKREYNIDVDERERKLLRLGQAENFGPYADDLIHRVGCAWSDLLTFLLEASPSVDESDDARKALRERGTFAEDLTRDEDRWTKVLAKLPRAHPGKVGKAAVLCDHFQRMAKFSFWHVVRRTPFMRTLVFPSEGQETDDQLTCRICLQYLCPFHGEIRGEPDHDVEGGDPDNKVVETDVILPQVVNYRKRVGFPSTVDSEPSTVDKRRTLEYWEKGLFGNLKWTPDDRGPFYPCHHPGVLCSDARCSCFDNKIACEKSCSCGLGCKRKWKGCSCLSSARPNQKAKLICWSDDRCVCYAKGRECDPDLCGTCGVADVLDPVHRHDDRVLQGRCRMSGLQRGIPKHTILGDSGVHGLGLYACEDMFEDDFVGEYKGETITKPEAERRGAVNHHQKLSYLFSLNAEQEIDGTYFGGKTRFINHIVAKKANLRPRIIMVNTVFRIAMFANRTIKAGEELFFDYGPMFPQEQLGITSDKLVVAVKSAPRVRNSGLVRDNFYDVDLSRDQDGNIRATKRAADADDSDDETPPRRLPHLRSVTLTERAGASAVTRRPRKAVLDEGALESDNELAVESAEEEDDDGDAHMDAQRRLSMYNVLETSADEDFEPEEDSQSEMDVANSDDD